MADKKITPLEQEIIKTLEKINEFKQACEANIVAIIYKDPNKLYDLDLKLEDFSNNIWRVYFQIASDLVLLENKQVLDDITIGLYLEKHPKLQKKYYEYNGYETIVNAGTYVQIENLDGYVEELHKWNTVIKLAKAGYPVHNKLSNYCDMTLEDIYNEHEVFLNHTFINIGNKAKSYDICDGIYNLIEKLDQGLMVGLPYYNMPILTKETGGQHLGSITLVGGTSGAGKSTFIRNATIPSIIEYDEKTVVMLNEEGLNKWQREMLIYVSNNIFKYDLQKYMLRDGKFTEEIKDILYKSADWLKENTNNHKITIIPFQKYQTSLAIKTIKKYAGMGIKYFTLDTFKLDAGKVTENSWLQMAQSMVDIHDIVKSEAKNLHALITFQLNKASTKQRYYTQDNIGISKSIIDVVETCIMIRNIFDDEYTGEKKELKVYRLEGKNGNTKIPVKLDKEKHYQILFIVKNREGSSGKYQIVLEHDLSRNILKEVGITNVPVDF